MERVAVELSCLLLAAGLFATCLGAVLPGQLEVSPNEEVNGCVPMTGISLKYCGTPYNRNCTTLPNMKEHTTLAEAEDEFRSFLQLLNCSESLKTFLCFYYFPLALPQKLLNGRTRTEINRLAHQFLPCRSECNTARAECEKYIIRNAPEVASWQPHLNCSLFPEASIPRKCVSSPNVTATTAPATQQLRTPPATVRPTSFTLSPSNRSSISDPNTTPTGASLSPLTSPMPTAGTTCNCGKRRKNVSAKTLKKDYSFIAKVNITKEGTDSGKIVYTAKVIQNYTISCAVPKIEKDAKIMIHTEMTPDCPCMSVTLNQYYVVCGHYNDRKEQWILRTKKGDGGFVLGTWDSKYDGSERNISTIIMSQRPVSC